MAIEEIGNLLKETFSASLEKATEGVVSVAQELREAIPAEVSRLESLERLRNISSWIGEINPNYDPFDVESPYGCNCGSCAYAVYRRLLGDPNIVATAKNIPYNAQMEALTGMNQVAMSPEAIRQYLLEQGSGAHAIIGVDRAQGPGHWFNAANIDGRVVAIDGQDGSVVDWPPDYGNVIRWEISV